MVRYIEKIHPIYNIKQELKNNNTKSFDLNDVEDGSDKGRTLAGIVSFFKKHKKILI